MEIFVLKSEIRAGFLTIIAELTHPRCLAAAMNPGSVLLSSKLRWAQKRSQVPGAAAVIKPTELTAKYPSSSHDAEVPRLGRHRQTKWK